MRSVPLPVAGDAFEATTRRRRGQHKSGSRRPTSKDPHQPQEEKDHAKNVKAYSEAAMMLHPELKLQDEQQRAQQSTEKQKIKLQDKQVTQQGDLGNKELKIKEKVVNKPATTPKAKKK